MRTLIIMALGATALATTSAANATAFVGSTGGCFGNLNNTPASPACTPTASATLGTTGLSFASGTFNQSDSNGFVGIGSGTGNDTLGFFTLTPTAGTTNFTGTPFTLLVSFTSPTGVVGVPSTAGTFFSTIIGSVSDSTAGGIQVDFDNTPHTFASNSGPFTLTVNDVAVSNDGVRTPITGYILTAVPEPTTWAMTLLGFAGIGFAMRRRRRPVLAQVA